MPQVLQMFMSDKKGRDVLLSQVFSYFKGYSRRFSDSVPHVALVRRCHELCCGIVAAGVFFVYGGTTGTTQLLPAPTLRQPMCYKWFGLLFLGILAPAPKLR